MNSLLKLLMAQPSKPKPPRQPSSVRMLPAAMTLIAAVLGIKAVAVAEEIAQAVPAATEHAADATAAPADPNAQTCAPPSLAEMAGLSQSEVQVLQALGARREALDARAASMETQDDLMAAAEHRLDERVAELRRLETTVNTLLGQLDETQEARLTSLVDVYQRMRAKDAAAVFDGLDDGVMVQVASRMRQANLAEVMGKMEPARARQLTQMLADLSRPPSDGQDLLNRSASMAPPAPLPAAPPAGGH